MKKSATGSDMSEEQEIARNLITIDRMKELTVSELRKALREMGYELRELQ